MLICTTDLHASDILPMKYGCFCNVLTTAMYSVSHVVHAMLRAR
jgi:hypothetical protein